MRAKNLKFTYKNVCNFIIYKNYSTCLSWFLTYDDRIYDRNVCIWGYDP